MKMKMEDEEDDVGVWRGSMAWVYGVGVWCGCMALPAVNMQSSLTNLQIFSFYGCMMKMKMKMDDGVGVRCGCMGVLEYGVGVWRGSMVWVYGVGVWCGCMALPAVNMQSSLTNLQIFSF